MKLWSSRSLTKASRRESGDHTGSLWLPNTLKSGRSGSPVAIPGFTGARKMSPSLSQAIHSPSEESATFQASATRQGSPPDVLTAHTALSAPRGSLAGFAIHPCRLGVCPRRNTSVEPSSEMRRFDRSRPSSSSKRVSRSGAKSGAAAVYTLRFPSSYSIQAMRSAAWADTSCTG